MVWHDPTQLSAAGGLATKLGVLDATLRSSVADRGTAVEALLAPEADPLHPARLRLTASDVRTLRFHEGCNASSLSMSSAMLVDGNAPKQCLYAAKGKRCVGCWLTPNTCLVCFKGSSTGWGAVVARAPCCIQIKDAG